MIELELGKVYKVVSGHNVDFSEGDIFYMDPRDGALIHPRCGWLDPDEITPELFKGLTLEVPEGYSVLHIGRKVLLIHTLHKSAGVL